jgi:restriction system protein
MRPTSSLLHDRLGDADLVWQTLGFIDAALASAPQQELESLDALRERGASLLVTSMEVHSPDTRRVLRETARRLHGAALADAVDLAFREEDFKDAASPWKRRVRSVEWSDVLDLADLFTSDSVTASYGRFFDPRVVPYLVGRYEDLAAMHWRKFEALVAEYFHRSGFEVELGPGRNDNGVDIRIWEAGATNTAGQPPLMIVQCKRERRKISKVVVKALAGLLVATIDWSPGAREVVRTRSYPVQEVNGEAVHSWLKTMHSSDTGLWLPE